MILIIANSEIKNGFNFIEDETFKLFDCKDIYRGKEDGSNIAIKDVEEYYADIVVKTIDIKDNAVAEAIIIDKYLGAKGLERAILISGHIATHRYNNSALDQLPLIISSWDKLIISELKDLSISNFFSVQGVFAKTYAELFQIVRSPTGEQEYKITQFLRKNATPVQWQNFKINYSFDDRHQIANEWGSVKLALNAGTSKEDINYDWPPTLHFKYLLKKHAHQILTTEQRLSIINTTIQDFDSIVSSESLMQDGKLKFSNHPYLRNKNVLLIDDNADKGWASVLKSLFFDEAEKSVEIREFKNVVLDSKNKLNIDLNHYSIVFLDLYLPDFPNQPTKISNGFLILKQIKEKFPHVPVIVFTASNKSWTLDEATERGADGMYVKESPEFAHDKKYLKENFESFVKTVLKCLDSYFILRPYWEKIMEIKENFLAEINDNELEKKFKSRIEERLEMFYGLLKRGMEQRKYDQERFYFSDYELAFMTLWSTLNEISEAYFDKKKKTFPISDIDDGTKYDFHLNKQGSISVLDHFVTWTFKRTGNDYIDYYVKKDNSGNIEQKNGFMKFYPCSCFEMVTDNNRSQIYPFFKTTSMSIIEKPVFYTEKLSMQIAYIIEMLNPDDKPRYFSRIIDLNQKRNSLYLTHGSDISSGFFSKKEKSKRNHPNYNINPIADIKDLFELVTFLLTGKEFQLDFY